MNRLLEKKSIWQEPLPGGELDQWESDVDHGHSKYGRFFTNRDEFEYFWMLPLSDDQRGRLLKDLWRQKVARMELEACRGKHGSNSDHRGECLECCTLHRPVCAEPYF